MPDQHNLARLVAMERQSRELALEAGDESMKQAHEAMAADYALQIIAQCPNGPG